MTLIIAVAAVSALVTLAGKDLWRVFLRKLARPSPRGRKR
jgi:hypothetical protein